MKNGFGLLVVVGLILASMSASADPKRISFPEDHASKFTFYSVHNRPDNGQVRHLFANQIAVESAKKGTAFANGSVFLIEIYKAKVDAEGKPIAGADGLWEKGEPVTINLMEKRAGWGDEHPQEIRNSDWNYAVFTPAKTHRDGVDEKTCLVCHKPLTTIDYVFSYDELVAKVAGVPMIKGEAMIAGMAGDVARGKSLFTRCSNCHSADATGRHKVGPNLAGVVGRQAGDAAGYMFSPGLKALGKNWDDTNLDAWLASPQSVVQRTKMAFPGFAKAQDRADVIAYLKTVK
jgi:cytochrome c2